MGLTNDLGSAVAKISNFIQILATTGGLDIKSRIVTSESGTVPSPSVGSASTHKQNSTIIKVDLSGNDTPVLLARNGELLHAIEHIAAKILRLEPEDHDQICFDAEDFKANRERSLELSAASAVQRVRNTGLPFSFSPMTSRERRLLHLILARSGLATASSGEGTRRFVIVYPEGHQTKEIKLSPTANPSPERLRIVREGFRPR